MRKIVWSPKALNDVARLRRFIQAVNPDAARRAVTVIRAGVKMLREHHEMGRPMHDLGAGIREKLVGFGASVYVIRYRIKGNEILIAAILHGREADF